MSESLDQCGDVRRLYSLHTWTSGSSLSILRHSELTFLPVTQTYLLLRVFAFIALQVQRACLQTSPVHQCHLFPFYSQNCHQLVSIVEKGVRMVNVKLSFSLGVCIFENKSFILLIFVDVVLTSGPFYVQMPLQYRKYRFLGLAELLLLAVLSDVFVFQGFHKTKDGKKIIRYILNVSVYQIALLYLLCAGTIKFVYNLLNMQFMSWIISETVKELKPRQSPSKGVFHTLNEN